MVSESGSCGEHNQPVPIANPTKGFCCCHAAWNAAFMQFSLPRALLMVSGRGLQVASGPGVCLQHHPFQAGALRGCGCRHYDGTPTWVSRVRHVPGDPVMPILAARNPGSLGLAPPLGVCVCVGGVVPFLPGLPGWTCMATLASSCVCVCVRARACVNVCAPMCVPRYQFQSCSNCQVQLLCHLTPSPCPSNGK